MLKFCKKRRAIQAQPNLHQSEKIKDLEDLCFLELTVISQIYPFMFVVAKTKGAQIDLLQHRPADLEN